LPELATISATAAATADLSTLVTALDAAGLVGTLDGAGPYTVFAPRNAAFADLDDAVLAGLLEEGNVDLLSRVLTFHVVSGSALSTDLTDGQMLTTLEGGMLTVGVSGSGVTINGANVLTADVEATNGVVHIIDAVLVPSETDVYETAVLTAGTTTLATAVLAGEFDDELMGAGPFTVFAPINSAFEALDASTLDALLDADNLALLQKTLGLHVIAGSAVMASQLTDGGTVTAFNNETLTFDLSDAADPKVNGVSIIDTDIEVANGVIHLVDEVLLPSFNIVETAILTSATSTLVAAVVAASTNGAEDLAATLSGAGPFTVFAPINDAFAALGTDRLDVLLDPANAEILSDILRYHVVSGDVRAADLAGLGGSATTYDGAELTFDLSDALDPKVNGVSIIATDIVTGNGVIHLIDGVLTQNLDIVDVATVEGFPTLVALVEQQGLTSTLRSDNAGAGWTVFAPTEAAFAALSSVPTGQALTDILTYHVLDATVESSVLFDGLVVSNTVNSASFTVNIDATTSAVSITDQAGNTVNVVFTDVAAANGIIHVIDGVIIPTP
jgi:transforming growth factor-beta-induced protein